MRSSLLLVALLGWGWMPALSSLGQEVALAPFLQDYCVRCHGKEEVKGDRDLESWMASSTFWEDSHTLREILDQLNLGEMPPDKVGVRQPVLELRRKVVRALTLRLGELTSEATSTLPRTRRLTRREYLHTLSDLLGIDAQAADLTGSFPPEERFHGFDHLPQAQPLSEEHLQQYLDAAMGYLDMAMVWDTTRPEAQRWVFDPGDLNGEKHNPGTVRYRVWGEGRAYLDIGHGQLAETGPTYPRAFAREGVPHPGRYRLRIRASAVGRDHPYDSSIYPNDLSQPLQLGIWHVPDASLLGKRASEGRVLIDVHDLPDDRPSSFETTIWMPAGSIPFVHWINGPGASKAILRKVAERYHPEAIRKSRSKVDQLKEQGLPVPEDALVQKVHISDVYQGPRVRIHEMSLEGPLYSSWPPSSHQDAFGAETRLEKVALAKGFQNFLSRAFRRDVSPEEAAPYVRYVRASMDSGVAARLAMQRGLAAALVSPAFLHLRIGPDQDGFDVASRLSYALWQRPPDAQLMAAARSEALLDASVYAQELERLMRHPHGTAFMEPFAEAWLGLHRLGTMPPGSRQFPQYDRDRLESAMRAETLLFLEEAHRENHPIPWLLLARESHVNGALARHYGLDGVTGVAFRKVAFPPHVRRSGLLGQASLLTASANGVDTSPVKRGVWILGNLLGKPPAPPPPDVPALEPDTRGASSIRDQLALHREKAACADCHQTIDPWGFALEHYDPIGAFRTHYPVLTPSGRVASTPGKAIDASARLPNGVLLQHEGDLRDELLRQQGAFTKQLVRAFFIHALGRLLQPADEWEVDRIAQTLLDQEGGFQDLVRWCLGSSVFLKG